MTPMEWAETFEYVRMLWPEWNVTDALADLWKEKLNKCSEKILRQAIGDVRAAQKSNVKTPILGDITDRYWELKRGNNPPRTISEGGGGLTDEEVHLVLEDRERARREILHMGEEAAYGWLDRRRAHFRMNAIANRIPLEEWGGNLCMSVLAFKQLVESGDIVERSSDETERPEVGRVDDADTLDAETRRAFEDALG